jgi:hypothetical protein
MITAFGNERLPGHYRGHAAGRPEAPEFENPQGQESVLFTTASTLTLGFTNWLSGIKWLGRETFLPNVSSFEVRNE